MDWPLSMGWFLRMEMTKVDLSFEIKDTGVKWTTADCGAGNTIFSAGIESWSCDFACDLSAAKEL